MANLRRIEEVVDVNHNGGAFIQLCVKTFRECRLAAPVDAVDRDDGRAAQRVYFGGQGLEDRLGAHRAVLPALVATRRGPVSYRIRWPSSRTRRVPASSGRSAQLSLAKFSSTRRPDRRRKRRSRTGPQLAALMNRASGRSRSNQSSFASAFASSARIIRSRSL